MTTHVALLRGINVGTAKRVAMPALRELATRLGYADVATHINSGNLLLSTDEDAATLRRRLEQGIEETFGLHADVVVRTREQLAAALAACPFPDGDPSRVVIAFLAGPAPTGLEERLATVAAEDEPFRVHGCEVHLEYGHGQASSRLAVALAVTLGVPATVRNLRTVTKLVDLARR
ncbi:MAG: hypothetical protein AVDCRST_MAG48-2440 [uncultured Friedmanniella sp.]|uniref:DUF1697 domain-containing protein n=1 Tax=uncultured Friedmanniella sp. TaxID=335381 RepID=A0A6J4KZA9_9ACTN|nr:MAG: hypothetical protein AVDCRST_MAG48-2440 [uncultured Friedmanniella sp.]